MKMLEYVLRYFKRVWNEVVLLFPSVFILALLAGLGVAVWCLLGTGNKANIADKISALMSIVQTGIFIVTGLFVYVQLTQASKQNERDRLVAWKNSVQQICQDILRHPEPYIPLLYGEGIEKKQAEKFVAAFASLHSLETIYFMRKDEQVPPTDLRKFVEAFITTSDDFQSFWRNEAFRPAFTLEFQKEVNSILGSTTGPRTPSPPPPQTPTSSPPPDA